MKGNTNHEEISINNRDFGGNRATFSQRQGGLLLKVFSTYTEHDTASLHI